MDDPLENSDYWRKRAEEARTMSERMLDSYTKVLMLGIAESYEQIAKSYDLIGSIFEQPLDTK
jgi:hypothetical protein